MFITMDTNTMQSYIFLAVDGVLNTPDDWTAEKSLTGLEAPKNLINRTKAGLLKYLVEATDSKIVLTCSWRFLTEEQGLGQKLEEIGWENASEVIVDHTPEHYGSTRDREVGEWLYNNCPSTTKFVVIDSIAPLHWHQGFQKHLVHINPDVGLTMPDVNKP